MTAEDKHQEDLWPEERDARPWVIAFVVFIVVVAVVIAVLVLSRPSGGGEHHGASGTGGLVDASWTRR